MSPDGAHAPVRVKFDAEAARREFPILEERIHERPLVYLDNANTTQKPKQYDTDSANGSARLSSSNTRP